jgi:hypothetical protein
MKTSPWLSYMLGVITGKLYDLPDATLTYEGDVSGPFPYFTLKTRMGRTFKVTVEEITEPVEAEKA